jgi:hypothetical protein
MGKTVRKKTSAKKAKPKPVAHKRASGKRNFSSLNRERRLQRLADITRSVETQTFTAQDAATCDEAVQTDPVIVIDVPGRPMDDAHVGKPWTRSAGLLSTRSSTE